MDKTNSFIIRFLIDRLKKSFIVGFFISIIIFIVFGKNMWVEYFVGFILGFLNFSLLTIGIDLILILKPRFVKLVHFLFFSFRYLIITFVIVEYILLKKANPFAVVGGLLTMNFSIFVFEMKKYFFIRKEG